MVSFHAETSCSSWRSSSHPGSTRWSPTSSAIAKFWRPSSTAATSSRSHGDAAAASSAAAASTRWTPTSRTAAPQWRPSPTGSTHGAIPEEEEYSPAIQRAQVLQLVQAGRGETADTTVSHLSRQSSTTHGCRHAGVSITATVDAHTAATGGNVHLEPPALGESVLLMSKELTTKKNPHFRSLRVRRASPDTFSVHKCGC